MRILILVISVPVCFATTESPDEAFEVALDRELLRMSMPPGMAAQIPTVLKDVRDVMDTAWPGTQVVKYGSSLGGTGFKTSDVDITVFPPNTSHIPTNDLVDQAVPYFKQHPELFDQIQVPQALVHVIKGVHVPSGIPVDITFNNVMSIRNTNVILRYLLDVDKRALQLASLVKLWAKYHNVRIHQKFTNYAIIMLVMFYLQQKHIVPTIAQLQRDVEPYYVNGWNTAYRELPFVSTNNETVYQLAGGFFKYYANFNYDKYVISILVGRPIKKSIYKNPEKLPKEFDLYKSNIKNHISKPLNLTGFTMHDCFEPCLKTGRYLNVKQFVYAARLYKKYNSTEFLKAVLSQRDLQIEASILK